MRTLQCISASVLLPILFIGGLLLAAPTSAEDAPPSSIGPEDDSSPAAEAAESLREHGFQITNDSSILGELGDKEIHALEGDTFQSISQREFLTSGLWRHLAEYNQLQSDSVLDTGQLIKVPRIYYRPREFAEVIYAHGDNLYIAADGSEVRPLSRNDQIFLSDEIRTGPNGFANVLFRTGATVNLLPSSHVKLRELGCLETDPNCFIEIEATEGGLVVDVPARPDSNSQDQQNLFHIRTPHAAAAVRGTQFDVDSGPQGMLVGVTEGDVAILADSDELSLSSGFGIKAQQNTPLGEPIELLPATVLRSVPPRLAAEDLISAIPLENAAQYEWKLSTDELATQILSQSVTRQPVFPLAITEAGDYFLHIRGIDENGLKGFSQSSKINVSAIDSTLAPIRLTASRKDQDMAISVIDPQERITGYEIQLSSSTDFIDPVSVDVGTSGTVIFSDQQEVLHVRARGLINPSLVTPFGPSLTLR